MPSKTIRQTRLYGSKTPGLRVVLPDKLEAEYYKKNQVRALVFKHKSPEIETDDAELQDYLEGNPKKDIPPHKLFKEGKIFRIPTKAEAEAARVEREQLRYRDTIKGQIVDGILFFYEVPLEGLRNLAEKCGISIFDTSGKKKLITRSLQQRILTTLDLEFDPPKREGAEDAAEGDIELPPIPPKTGD